MSSHSDDICECGHHRGQHQTAEVALVPGECMICHDYVKCPGYRWRGDGPDAAEIAEYKVLADACKDAQGERSGWIDETPDGLRSVSTSRILGEPR